jgi:hypothetical protein
VNAEAFIRLTDPRWIDYCVSCSSIITPLVYDETPHLFARGASTAGLSLPPTLYLPALLLDHTPSYPLECWPSSNKVSPRYGHSPLSTAQLLGSMDLPQFDFTSFFFFPSRSLNGAASALGLVSVFIAIPTPLFSYSPSCILIVFICFLRHQFATITYHPPSCACRSLLHLPPLLVVFTVTVTTTTSQLPSPKPRSDTPTLSQTPLN